MAKANPKLPVEVLPDLLAWWRKTRVKGVIIGGLAVAFRGRPRITLDVDAIIFLKEERWPEFLKKGEELSFRTRIPELLEFAKQSRVFVLHHEKTGIDVDLSLGSLAVEEQTLERASRVKIGKHLVPVASAESLIILKAVANRPKDIGDIDGVLDRAEKLDLAYVRQHVGAIALALDVPEIKEELERLLQRRTQHRRMKKHEHERLQRGKKK